METVKSDQSSQRRRDKGVKKGSGRNGMKVEAGSFDGASEWLRGICSRGIKPHRPGFGQGRRYLVRNVRYCTKIMDEDDNGHTALGESALHASYLYGFMSDHRCEWPCTISSFRRSETCSFIKRNSSFGRSVLHHAPLLSLLAVFDFSASSKASFALVSWSSKPL